MAGRAYPGAGEGIEGGAEGVCAAARREDPGRRGAEPCGRLAVVFASALVVLHAAPAHAYLDGGTGSMMLQLLLGGLAGLGIALRLYWHRLLAFFGIRRRSGAPAAEGGGSSGGDGAVGRD